jgi:hypothetical protein
MYRLKNYIFMKYTVEMGSGAMTYTQSFINIGSGIQKLKGEGDTDIQTQSMVMS